MKFWQGFKSVLYPRHFACVECQKEICGKRYDLCDDCLRRLRWNDGFTCEKCGCALPYVGTLCGRCAAESFAFDKGYSALMYEGLAQQLIRRWKFEGERYLTEVFATILADYYATTNLSFDVVVPVPMTKFAEKSRGFHHTGLLARAFCDIIRKECDETHLTKRKETPPQVGRTASERRENLKGAFAVTDASAFSGKNVLLLDDVKTTGATANECAEVLLRAGAARVTLLTIASVAQKLRFEE